MKKSVVAVLTAVGTGAVTFGAIIATKGIAKEKALKEMIKTNERFNFDKENVEEAEYKEETTEEDKEEQENEEEQEQTTETKDEDDIIIDDSDINVD